MNTSHTKILPYQTDWPQKFESEKEKIQSVFSEKALKIEHIGSTSISGLSSKPIIDIAVLIENHNDADSFTEPLANIGYIPHPTYPKSTERYFYIKGDPIEYHLSIAYADQGGFWDRQILFRDYLRNHPETRDEYGNLKIELLKKYPTGKDGYIEGKSDFINKVLKLAELEN
jgi:GrpB-like predicted nucleotidyltransferase (UPF0157 family)